MATESSSQAQPEATSTTVTPIKTLILDAGPLLSLTPLRNLATRYLTTPAVLAELRDVNARDHWERLKLLAGVEVEVREPDALSMTKGEVAFPLLFTIPIRLTEVWVLVVNSHGMGKAYR